MGDAARGHRWRCLTDVSAAGFICGRSLPGQGKGKVLALAVPEGGYWSAGRDVLGGPVLTPHPPSPSRTCEEPASNPPHVWPDDITKWPVRARWHRELGGTVVAASMGGNKPGLGGAWGRTLTLASLPPACRSAPTRPKPTTRASPTWTARSRAGPAASAPRAGGLQPWGHLTWAQLPSLPSCLLFPH